MLFNSFEFLFGFLPFALLLFYGLAQFDKRWGMWALAAASIGFYAYWRPGQTWVLLASIVFNFIVGRLIQNARETKPLRAKHLLWFGLAVDLGALLYFKYTMFIVENVNAVAYTDIVLQRIILPLGISFFTFQKIAYLDGQRPRRSRCRMRPARLCALRRLSSRSSSPARSSHYKEIDPPDQQARCSDA